MLTTREPRRFQRFCKLFVRASDRLWPQTIVGLLVLGIGVAGCEPAPDRKPSSPNAETAIVSPDASPTPSPIDPPATTPPPDEPSADQMLITVYQIDAQCEEFLTKTIKVPRDRPLDATVGWLLNQSLTADFDLAGYRVEWEPGQTEATIDMRLSPNAVRRFSSLSSCEQRAIFGSLTRTLTEHPDWSIQQVRFTEQGEELVF